MQPLGVNLVTGDITDRERVAETVPGHDWVIHLAADAAIVCMDLRKYPPGGKIVSEKS